VIVEQKENAQSGINNTSLGIVMVVLAPQEEQLLQGK